MTSESGSVKAVQRFSLGLKGLLLVWIGLALVQIVTPLWYPTPDACCYLSLARSLAETGSPTRLGSPNWTYGIGYPLLVSPLYLAASSPFLLLSLLHAGLAALYVWGVYRWVRYHAPQAALPIALISVGNVTALIIYRRALSEVLFMAVMIWLLNVFAAFQRDKRFGRGGIVAAALLLLLLAITRQVGILFAAGFGLFLTITAWRQEMPWRRGLQPGLAVSLPALLVMSALICYDRQMAQAAGGFSNWDIFVREPARPVGEVLAPTIAAQCLEGLRLRIEEVGRLLVPGMFSCYRDDGRWLEVNMLVWLPLATLVGIGWWRFLRSRPDVFALTAPLYVALYIYWPFNQSGRYFLPLVPLLLLCLWFAWGRLPGCRLPLFRALVVAHMVVAVGHWLFLDNPQARADNRRWGEIRALALAIRDNPGLVSIGPGLGNAWWMLQYELDQAIQEGTPPRDAPWVLVRTGGRPLPGLVGPASPAEPNTPR